MQRAQAAASAPIWTNRERWRGWPVGFVSLCVAIVLGFIAAPGTLESKSIAALHGLCAQRPDHTIFFGESRLPFDARMTGIYGGFACASLVFLLRRRWRATGLPSPALISVLSLFVMALAVDGVNSTARDAGFWSLYTPSNTLRLVTGLLAGTALAVFIWLLLASLAFAPNAILRRAPLAGFGELSFLLGVQAVFATLVLSGEPLLRVPVTGLLLAAAVTALTALALVFVLLIARRENQARSTSQLARPATIAVVVALGIIALTGTGRYLLEAWMNLPPAG